MKRPMTNKFLIVVASVLVLVGTGAVVFYVLNKDPAKDLSDVSSTGQRTKGEPQKDNEDNTPNESSDDSTDPATDNKKTTDTNQDVLDSPRGNFVSSHSVKMKSLIASSCVTTPGATCTIRFTNGDTQKMLEARTTDKEGAAYWEWTPEQVGLTPGSWTITAVAANGNNEKTAQDVIPLEVSQ